MTKTERKTIKEVKDATRIHLEAVDRLFKMKKLWKSHVKAHNILLDVLIGLDITEDILSILLKEGF